MHNNKIIKFAYQLECSDITTLVSHTPHIQSSTVLRTIYLVILSLFVKQKEENI